jgi:hypothetical protein
MAAVTDFADNAAATAAGYQRVQVDRGVGAKSTRFISRYEKWLTGASGASGFLSEAEGQSDVSQAAADTAALTILNTQRRHRYGGSPGRASGASDSPHSGGGTHTIDTT